jgi:hypothetical protein
MRKPRRVGGVVLQVKVWVRRLSVGALAVAGPACATDAIEHGPERTPITAVTMTTGAETASAGASFSSSDGFFGDTNFPEPAITACGGLENMDLPIGGMISAWGVVALAGADDGFGDVEAGSVRVRLGAQPLFDCREAIAMNQCGGGDSSSTGTSGSTSGGGGSGSGGECGWGLAFTLSPAEAVAGTLKLDELERPKFELVTGAGPISVDEATGELQLIRVTPDCIAGDFDNVAFDGGADHPDFEGGFVAQLCPSMCVPYQSHKCL